MNPALKISPKNLLEWSDMEDWVSGTTSAPTEHTLSGTGATIAREATIVKQGTYSAAVTRVGNDATLYFDLPTYAAYAGRQITFGCWVYATVASRARISLGDGVGTTNSSYHSGVAGWEFLTVTRNIDTSNTRIRAGMEVNTGNTTAYFDGGILIEGPTPFTDLSSYLGQWNPNKQYRLSKFIAARRPGSIIQNVEHSDLGIALNGKVFGTTPTAARTSFDAMLQAVNDGQKYLYLYDDRFIPAYLESEQHKYIAALRCMEFDLKFVAPSPFSQFLQKYRSQQAISSSPTSFTVTVNGSAYTKPKLYFVAGGTDITSCTLENLTTGEILSFTGTVTAGDTLEIDCLLQTVLNDSVDSVGSFVGDFFKMVPGANLLKFTGDDCTLKVDWFDRWL